MTNEPLTLSEWTQIEEAMNQRFRELQGMTKSEAAKNNEELMDIIVELQSNTASAITKLARMYQKQKIRTETEIC